MQSEIRIRGMKLTRALSDYCDRRLAFAFDRVQDRLAHLRISLSDINGPRGGDDKRCVVRVKLKGHGEVHVEALASSSTPRSISLLGVLPTA